MEDKITILETEGFFNKVIQFFTKKNLKVEIEVLNKKVEFYEKVEETFFKKAKALMEKYSSEEAVIQILKIENETLRKELSELKNDKGHKIKQKKEEQKSLLKQLNKLSGKKKELFELVKIKKVKDDSEIMSQLGINNNYYRQLKFIINKEVGVKIE